MLPISEPDGGTGKRGRLHGDLVATRKNESHQFDVKQALHRRVVYVSDQITGLQSCFHCWTAILYGLKVNNNN